MCHKIIFLSSIIVMSFLFAKIIFIHAQPAEKTSEPSPRIERFDSIYKSPLDRRIYRGLVLRNGMKVLLISDPQREESAASVVIGTGALNDPRDTPGLASLASYLVINSNHQYEYFEKFVEFNGGKIDPPTTDADSQMFSFKINSLHLRKALKKFAHLFIDPIVSLKSMKSLFDIFESAHKEYLRCARSDNFRVKEVEKFLCKEKHPYHHFFLASRGTIVELNASTIYAKMVQFHSSWYSSNIMSLTVLGKENVDVLEDMVVPLFERVEDRNARRMINYSKFHPWGEEQLKHKIYIVPLAKNLQLLSLNFPVPDVRDQFETAPEMYVTYFLLHKGPGTLHTLLTKRRLCEYLETTYTAPAGIAVYTISCYLTDIGLKRIDEIVNLIFQYIHLLNSDGVRKEMFEEVTKVYELAFENAVPNDVEPLATVKSLAYDMQKLPLENILWYQFYKGGHEWKPHLVQKFLCCLQPDNVNISIVSQSIKNKVSGVEKRYKTSYGVEKIPKEILQKWKTKQTIIELQLPPLNQFLPKQFDVYPIGKDERKNPYILYKSSVLEVWFKQDDQFQVPVLFANIELTSSKSHCGPFGKFLWYLFQALVKSTLNDTLYYPNIIGFEAIHWEILQSDQGLNIELSTFSDKLAVLLKTVIFKLTNFWNDVTEENFKIMLDKFFQTGKRKLTENEFYIQYLLFADSWTADVIFNAGKLLQYGDLKKFLSQVFQRIFVQALIHGNCTKEKAADIVDILREAFHSSRGLLPQEIMRPRYVEISGGSSSIYHIKNEESPSRTYLYTAYFQLSTSPSILRDVASDSLLAIIDESCHQKFTAEAVCFLYDNHGLKALIFTVRSEKEQQNLDSKLEEFLSEVLHLLKNMPDERFESLKEKASMNPNHLHELSYRYWCEISNRSYNFDRTKTDIKQLQNLKKTDFLNFAMEVLNVSSVKRRKFVVKVFPKHFQRTKSNLSKRTLPATTEVSDINTFRNESILLPSNFHTPEIE